ncbi:hypothetical protein SGR_6964 [Streptomyces griseus subsp. griseus NBRC 13350]|uniref:Uncharacterized protein n=1 Tax=Streptomyces griseus subsp. griseus (strain JCM 4626 / CBS 651.72 / NBRC 13350 / KCC S-0626 / ISP 5235) TaxID=455632 RepID=B1VPP3_STRGG|nr:hypothetical protein SGR_6964 [Streptomyces griseus subsp. griseus NBRC 13350]
MCAKASRPLDGEPTQTASSLPQSLTSCTPRSHRRPGPADRRAASVSSASASSRPHPAQALPHPPPTRAHVSGVRSARPPAVTSARSLLHQAARGSSSGCDHCSRPRAPDRP